MLTVIFKLPIKFILNYQLKAQRHVYICMLRPICTNFSSYLEGTNTYTNTVQIDKSASIRMAG